MLQDMAVVTGATVISEEKGYSLDKADMSFLGRADRVKISEDSTILIGGAGKKEELDGRMEQIRSRIKAASSDYDRDKLQEWLAKLSGMPGMI